MEEFVNLTQENIDKEHLCCIIREKKLHPGIEAKKTWLKERIVEGHVFRKLNVKGTVFIEYAPLETAWVPIVGDNYLYIYCLWVAGEYRQRGYARELITYCIEDAKRMGKSGICMLGAKKQKGWLSNQEIMKHFGFRVADVTENDYELLALSFDGTVPRFSSNVHEMAIKNKELTIYYSPECPFILQTLPKVVSYCEANDIPITTIPVTSLKQAKELPCVFNNYAVFFGGNFVTVNLIDPAQVNKIIRKG